MRPFYIGSILIGSLIISRTPVKASLVRDVSMTSACQGDIPLVVYSGMGATVDFTQTGKAVQRAWLGDPSRVTLDADRPIEQGSTVLYLRRIEGITFTGLPSTASTVLSTVLVGADGAEVCQFPVSYSTGSPPYTSLRLTTEAPGLPGSTDRPPITLPVTSVNIDDVETGINANEIALGQDSPVVTRVNDFIARVRNGDPQQATAREMEIEWPLIVELSNQGQASSGASSILYQ